MLSTTADSSTTGARHGSIINNKSICQYYFVVVSPRQWKCKKCKRLKTKNGGWTNLLNHVRTCIGDDYEKVYEAGRKEQRNGGIQGFVLTIGNLEREMFDWIEFVVMKSLPIGFVDCPYTRRVMKSMKTVSGKTLRQHILSLTDVMRQKIKDELPSKFVVVFDGWSEGTEHYIAVSAAYTRANRSTGKEEPVNVMLTMKPLLANGVEGMTAADHVEHISRSLKLYDRKCSDILCIVGDNCGVNRLMAKTLRTPLIGCASHKLNLGVKLWMKNEPQLSNIVAKVSSIMKKASNLKVAAKLRELTHYSPVRENVTRWSSTYQMIARFLKIEEEMRLIVDLVPLFPTDMEMDIIKKAFVSLKKFDGVTIMLQKEGLSFIRAREIFDAFLEDFPEMDQYLADDACIVENPVFERAIMRIVNGLPLTDVEKRAASRLVKPQEDSVADVQESLTNNAESVEESYTQILERRLKRQKMMQSEGEDEQGKYWNLEMIPGTSVICERHFSLAKHILTDTRKRTTPLLFEALLTLKVNRNWWDVYSVGVAIGRIGIDDGSNTEEDCEDNNEEHRVENNTDE